MKTVQLLISILISGYCFSQQVDGGNGHAIILDKDGFVYTVGSNNYGQLGTSILNDLNTPYSL